MLPCLCAAGHNRHVLGACPPSLLYDPSFRLHPEQASPLAGVCMCGPAPLCYSTTSSQSLCSAGLDHWSPMHLPSSMFCGPGSSVSASLCAACPDLQPGPFVQSSSNLQPSLPSNILVLVLTSSNSFGHCPMCPLASTFLGAQCVWSPSHPQGQAQCVSCHTVRMHVCWMGS